MEYTEQYKAFCKRLSIYRKLLDYNQLHMADILGLTKPEYVNRESGRSLVSGKDIKKLSDTGADIDKLLVDSPRKTSSHVISGLINEYDNNTIEYMKNILSDYIVYLCEKKKDNINTAFINNVKLLKAMDKDSTADSMLKCIRDINKITDQQVISDSLGISRFKYSKIENNKEYPDAMVLIRLYELYGYVPSMYLKLYDIELEIMDYIYDDLTQNEQKQIIDFINNLKNFV